MPRPPKDKARRIAANIAKLPEGDDGQGDGQALAYVYFEDEPGRPISG